MSLTTRVAVHGAPRSGTTWLGEIINSSPQVIYKFQPLFSWCMKHCALQKDSSADSIRRFFDTLAATDDEFLDQVQRRQNGVFPAFAKETPTHVAYKEVRYHYVLPNLVEQSDTRVVLLVRSPMAVINSWLRAPREFRRDLGWKEEEEWRHAPHKNQQREEEYNGFERWKEVVRMFTRLATDHPDRVLLIEYRDLLDQTLPCVTRLFEFLNLELGEQTRAFVQESQNREDDNPYSVFRKNQTDERWKSELQPDIVSEIKADLKGTDLERFL